MGGQTPDSLKGHFLIAMPGLADPNFTYTVTCLCEHSSHGAVGIVVNRVHPALNAKMIFDELDLETAEPAASIPIHSGGPVHTDELFILHGPPFGWEGCLQITPTLALSNSRDIITALTTGSGPDSFLIALGCAGWGPGQLESEIKQNSWLTCPVSHDLLFEVPVENRWYETVKTIGIEPALLSGRAGHA